MGEVVCDTFLFTMLALRGAGSGALLEVLGGGWGEEGEGRQLRWANHTQKHKQTSTSAVLKLLLRFHCATFETIEEEVVLSLIKAEAATQEPKCNREDAHTRHKNQQPGGVDRHLGFNWKQKQNNRAIHKSETKEMKALDKHGNPVILHRTRLLVRMSDLFTATTTGPVVNIVV